MSQLDHMHGPPTSTNNSTLVCGGCSTLLMYPAGASSVRCQRCSSITRAPPSHPSSGGASTAQIVCSGCRTLLAYAQGAESVQCSVCRTLTHVPRISQTVCGGCQILLQHPSSANCVKCSVCNFITPVAGGAAAPTPQTASQPTVIIENPDGAISAIGVKVPE